MPILGQQKSSIIWMKQMKEKKNFNAYLAGEGGKIWNAWSRGHFTVSLMIPWPGLAALSIQLHRLRYLRKRFKNNPSPARASQISAAETQLHCVTMSARSSYESSLVTHFAFSNDSRIYKCIRSFTNKTKLPESHVSWLRRCYLSSGKGWAL